MARVAVGLPPTCALIFSKRSTPQPTSACGLTSPPLAADLGPVIATEPFKHCSSPADKCRGMDADFRITVWRLRAHRLRRRTQAVLLAAAVASLLVSGSAFAADSVPFASVSGTCDSSDSSSSSYETAPQPAARTAVIARLEVQAGSGGSTFGSFSGPDTIWASAGSVSAGDRLRGYVYCSPDSPYTVTYYDRPTTPTAFSGSTTPGGTDSSLPFRVPGGAQYVADLSLSQGAVTLDQRAFASSGRLEMGTLRAGDNSLEVAAKDGPQARWSVSIRALPVVLSALKFDHRAVRAGTIVKGSYTTSGDTTVTGNVVAADGRVVRSLASGLPLGLGEHSLTWDGLDGGGRPVPDGTYALRLDSLDPSGERGAGQATITIDSAPPKFAVSARNRLRRSRAIVVQVTDKTSGVRSASLRIGKRTVKRLRRGQKRLIYRPSRGWRPGTHSLRAVATDVAGNSARLTRRLRVR